MHAFRCINGEHLVYQLFADLGLILNPVPFSADAWYRLDR